MTNQTHATQPATSFFRVATEGATTDGRVIDRNTITQLAASFNPATYGARIWMEHIRGIYSDSPFKAYGDVIAVKAEEVDTDSGKKMALFAQISPTPELIAMTRARQKIYTSLEIDPNFAKTGQPYLVGLGVTDSPASLGTEILKFSAGLGAQSHFASRKHKPDNCYTEAQETMIAFDDATSAITPPIIVGADMASIMTKFASLFKKPAHEQPPTEFAQYAAIAEVVMHLGKVTSAQQAQITAQQAQLTQGNNDFAALKFAIDSTATGNPRPPATGGTGMMQTDF